MNIALNFWRWLLPEDGSPEMRKIPCSELSQAARELRIRELCFWVCVNMVANALGRCEVRTFRSHAEVQERDYYTWNIEPNHNQNSTAFMHKLVATLYLKNEALIVDAGDLGPRPVGRPPGGGKNLVVADDWNVSSPGPTRENVYTDITIGDACYKTKLKEGQVLRLTLNHKHMRPVIMAMCESFEKLADAAAQHYEWASGRHIKVHIDQVAEGDKDFEANFQRYLADHVTPYTRNRNAVLPEFDGYLYTDESGEEKLDSQDVKNLTESIFEFTARGLLLPVVLVNGKVEATKDATARFLTNCIDPICDQLQEEINRKSYGYERWVRGDYVRVDSSAIIHFDLFENAASVEKLIGSAAYTVNDVLWAANQPTISEPWADEHFMTRNLATIDEVLKNMSAAAQKGGSN